MYSNTQAILLLQEIGITNANDEVKTVFNGKNASYFTGFLNQFFKQKNFPGF